MTASAFSDRPATEVADLRARAFLLAAATQLDPRTCVRALQLGVKALRSERTRRRVASAAKDLHIDLP